MRIPFTVVAVALLCTFLPGRAGSQPVFNLKIQQAEAVSLDVCLNLTEGVSIESARRVRPQALDVLTGPFFHVADDQLALIGLVVVRGKRKSSASGLANRGALIQTKEGRIEIVTEAKAAGRTDLVTAVEAAPLMVAGGVRRWYDRDVGSAGFYGDKHRLLVGLTEEGDFFWVHAVGQLGSLHQQVEAELAGRGKTLRDLLNLDGGSSVTDTGAACPPARLVVLPRDGSQVLTMKSSPP